MILDVRTNSNVLSLGTDGTPQIRNIDRINYHFLSILDSVGSGAIIGFGVWECSGSVTYPGKADPDVTLSESGSYSFFFYLFSIFIIDV